MEQLRLVDPGSPRRRRRRPARPTPARASDWRLDPRLRRIGKRKVAEARQVLIRVRDEVLEQAS